MDTKLKLTVLMLSYNNADVVAESLESVLNQKGFDDFEIVITDDASQDGTPDIIRKYEGKYPTIIKAAYNEKNLGITDNFNQTLKRCSGQYISFLAADDLYEPHKLKKQVAVMEANPHCVLSYHNVTVFGDAVHKEYLYYGGLRGRTPRETQNGNITAFICERNFLVAPSVMVRSDTIPAHGFHQDIPRISDWLFFTEIATKGDVIYIDEVLGGYRRHGNNTTSAYIDSAEFETSYAILEHDYPQYQRQIEKGKARLYQSYAILSTMRGQFKEAGQFLKKTLRLIGTNGITMALFLFQSLIKDLCQYSFRLLSGWKV